MTTPADPFTLAVVGYADAAAAPRAVEYEDRVLALLGDHGARLLYRGRRAAGADASLPLEVHLIWFPDRPAFEAYLRDERRLALLAEYGEVFTTKHAVEMEAISALGD